MADNVMALVKKKGPEKKLRGKKAQAAKKREATAVRPKRIPDKRNPFRPFRYMEPSEMIEELDDFVAQAGWTQDRQVPDPNLDREMVKLFSLLKTGIPFPLVKTFFEDFDESNSFNVVRFFDEFKQRPDVRARVESMKELIIRRQATPLELQRQVGGERQYKQIIPLDRLRQRAVSPMQRPRIMFGPDEILSQCEREYRRAPWMFPFTDQVIRGFALKDIDPELTTPQEVKDGWYKVKMSWYRIACEGKRRFVPGKVAYVTVNNDLIIETEDMYMASKQDWIREFTPLDTAGFEIAKGMIMDNNVLKSVYSGIMLEEYAETIIASFGNIETNYDLARKLSYVLVYLSPLIEQPQIYHERIRNQQYPGDVLIRLDRYTLLPEVFSDPNVDKTPIENKIKRARRSIENKYYDLIKQSDPTVRRRRRPKHVEVPVHEEAHERVVALPAVLPKNVVSVIPERYRKVARELAPGLFQRLRERITQMIPVYCNQCDAEVFAPPYTTPRGEQRLKFCSKECFDRYDI